VAVAFAVVLGSGDHEPFAELAADLDRPVELVVDGLGETRHEAVVDDGAGQPFADQVADGVVLVAGDSSQGLAPLDQPAGAVVFEHHVAILRALLDVIERFGAPKYVRTDNEAVFTSRLFRLGLRLLGIRHQRTAPFAPWQNGRIERFFGTFKQRLRIWFAQGTAGFDLQEDLDHHRGVVEIRDGSHPVRCSLSCSSRGCAQESMNSSASSKKSPTSSRPFSLA
jgi:hypothetical protein